MLVLLQILVITSCHLLLILAIMTVLRQSLKVALICIFLIAKHVGLFKKSVSHKFRCPFLRIQMFENWDMWLLISSFEIFTYFRDQLSIKYAVDKSHCPICRLLLGSNDVWRHAMVLPFHKIPFTNCLSQCCAIHVLFRKSVSM